MEEFKSFLEDCMDAAEDVGVTPQVRVVPRISKTTGDIEFYAHSQSGSSRTYDSEVANAAEDAARAEAAEAEVARAEAAETEYAGHEGALLTEAESDALENDTDLSDEPRE